jgi:hypothetical protein
MRRIAALLGISAIVAATVSPATAAPPHRARITVKPATGFRWTSFAVGFRAPQRTGRYGAVQRRYWVFVAGPSGGGCDATASTAVPPTPKGLRISVAVFPSRGRGGWCPGTYHGRVQELQTHVCPPGKACPHDVVLLRTVGKFRFDVRSWSGSGDTTPPAFGGLARAFACTPGPQRPGETTPSNLSWQPATDDVTPSPEIVYDVYLATTPGGEDFSTPTWITPPGATSFRTPGLPSHGTFYFVVRARDQAGNEDRNRVEHRGIDPCV